MIRTLALLATLPLAFLRTDYTDCKVIHNAPLEPKQSERPFARQPDFAALATYPKTMVFDGMPPERMRGPSTMTVSTGSVDKCGDPPPNTHFEACVRGDIVHMPNPCNYPDEEFARLLCHEQAHKAWGWPADHGA